MDDTPASPDWFIDFETLALEIDGQHIHARIGGPPGAPPLVLLHGFPQTHVMWHRVARELARDFRIVLPDLRGYGDSARPTGAPDHSNYSKRAMAADVVGLMSRLGYSRFALAGHDRGGRVAHRLAINHPEAVSALCVLDIAPTLDMYAATNLQFARAYYHWFFLIQPAPLPETLIGAAPRDYLHAKLGGWGSGGLAHIEPRALAEYQRCFCRADAIHAACEDYRAAAGIDLEHDRESRAAGRRIACDLLVLWGERGVVHRLFDPLSLWRAQCAGEVSGYPLDCGHFIAEERPRETAQALREFLRGRNAR
jgi:haloacetate dehalogenase